MEMRDIKKRQMENLEHNQNQKIKLNMQPEN